MNRKRKIGGLIVILFTVTIIIYQILFQSFTPTVENRNTKDNPASQSVIFGKGEYIVGEDLEPGYYDITCITEKVTSSNGFNLIEDEKIIGKICYDENKIYIDSGTIKLEAAKFEKITLNDFGTYEIENSGYYLAGSEIPHGEYSVIVETSQDVENSIIINVFSNIGQNQMTSQLSGIPSTDVLGKTIQIYKDNVIVVRINRDKAQDIKLFLKPE